MPAEIDADSINGNDFEYGGATETASNQESPITPPAADEESADEILKGTLELISPILSRGKELSEIDYDFSAITIEELTSTLDRHMGGNPAAILPEQQFAVFALACRGYEGLDEKDLLERMQAEDGFAASIAGGKFLDYLAKRGNIRLLKSLAKSEDAKELYRHGCMELEKPVTGPEGREIQSLAYDFSRLTGNKYVEILGSLADTQTGFCYRKARKLYLEAVKTANGWNDAVIRDIEKKLTLEDIFSGQRVAIGFFITTCLGARRHTKPKQSR
jgi:hypothetical protein